MFGWLRRLYRVDPQPSRPARSYAQIGEENYDRETFEAEFVGPLREALKELESAVRRAERLTRKREDGVEPMPDAIAGLEEAVAAGARLVAEVEGLQNGLFFEAEASYGRIDALADRIFDAQQELDWLVKELRSAAG
jgi:hypothetical protein